MQKFSQTTSDQPWFGKRKPIMFLSLCQNKTHRIPEWFNRLNMAKVECIAPSPFSKWPLCLFDPLPQATAVASAWLNPLSAFSWPSSPYISLVAIDHATIFSALTSQNHSCPELLFHSISRTKQPCSVYKPKLQKHTCLKHAWQKTCSSMYAAC